MNRLNLGLWTVPSVLVACGGSTTLDGTDITDAIFSNRSADCADYTGTFTSEVRDNFQGVDVVGSVEISTGNGSCTLSSNSIPNHDFGGGDAFFADPAAEVDATVDLPQNPSPASTTTPGP